MHQLPRPLFLWHLKVDFTTARWDFRSSPQSPPLISAFEWTFELQVGASSRPSSWQQDALRCGKKVGWLLCFAMFFSAKLFNWKFTPCSAIFCHSPSTTFKTPRPTPRSSHGFNPTTRKRSRAIDHASGENCDFFLSII
jgi:hypothetical protein